MTIQQQSVCILLCPFCGKHTQGEDSATGPSGSQRAYLGASLVDALEETLIAVSRFWDVSRGR